MSESIPEVPGNGSLSDVMATIHSGRNIAHLLLFARDGVTSLSGKDANDLANEIAASESAISNEEQSKDLLSKGYAAQCYRGMPDTVVDQVKSDARSERPFFATEFAAERVMPLAALVADLCVEHTVSPVGLVSFRRGHSGKAKPTYVTRNAIYTSLLRTNDALSGTEIADAIEADPATVHKHLASLRTQAIIEDRISHRRNELPTYLPGDLIKELKATGKLQSAIEGTGWNKPHRRLARRLVSHFALMEDSSATPQTVDGIIDMLNEEPELKKAYLVSGYERQHRHNITKVLDFLTEQGAVKEATNARRTIEGVVLAKRELVASYIKGLTLGLLNDPEFTARYQERAQAIANDDQTMAWLLNADFSLGAITQRRSTSEMSSLVRTLLVENGALTTQQIATALNVAPKVAAGILNRVSEDLPLSKQRNGRRVLYSLANTSANPLS